MFSETEFRGVKYKYYDEDGGLSKCMFATWTHEVASRNRLLADIGKGDTFIDCGSCHGSYSIPAAMLGAKVWAIDMGPQGLLRNIELNGLEDKITFIKSPLSDRIEPGRFANWTKWKIKSKLEEGEEPEFVTDTLDNIMKEYDFKCVDVLKMDIESHELEALRGGVEFLRKFRPNMMIECHDFMSADMSNRVVKFIESLDLGYKSDIVDTQTYPPCYHVFFTSERIKSSC